MVNQKIRLPIAICARVYRSYPGRSVGVRDEGVVVSRYGRFACTVIWNKADGTRTNPQATGRNEIRIEGCKQNNLPEPRFFPYTSEGV